MIVTATCCVAFVDYVYLQYLATITTFTFQIKRLPVLFSQVCTSDLWTRSRWDLNIFSIYCKATTDTCTHTNELSYTQYNGTWQTVRKQKTRHGLAHAVRWFSEVCLAQLHSRTAESCSWTSQDSELGGRIIECPEAISCQDRRPLQSDGPNRGNDLSSPDCGWGYQSSDDWCCFVCLFCFILFFPAYSPASETKMDRFIHRLIREADKWEDWRQRQSLCECETRTDCNGERQEVVSLCLFWYFSSVKILMNRLHVQKPSGPMGLPKPLLLGNPKYKLYMNS